MDGNIESRLLKVPVVTEASCTGIMLHLYKEVLKFLKPSAFSSCPNVLEINFNLKYRHKDNKDLVLGAKCRKYVKEKKMEEKKIDAMCGKVRAFYITAVKYLKENLPITSEHKLLQRAEVFNLTHLPNRSLENIQYFIDEFATLEKQVSHIDKLQEQFLQLQVETIPKSVLDEPDARK